MVDAFCELLSFDNVLCHLIPKRVSDIMGPLERHFFNIGYQIGYQAEYQAGYQIGYEEGRKMAIEKVAKSLLAIGKPLELIQKCTGMADAEFQALVASLRLHPASQPKKASA